VRGPDRPRLWRDTEEIAASELFDERIRDAIGQSSVFVVVLSPNWISRPQNLRGRRELAAFAERWKDEGNRSIKHRIVVVGTGSFRGRTFPNCCKARSAICSTR